MKEIQLKPISGYLILFLCLVLQQAFLMVFIYKCH